MGSKKTMRVFVTFLEKSQKIIFWREGIVLQPVESWCRGPLREAGIRQGELDQAT
jgi:hypothetical protein